MPKKEMRQPMKVQPQTVGRAILETNLIKRKQKFMTKITKILLAISLSAFALGATGIFWGFGFPVGAIFFGWFMIFKALEKEMALYDQEQALRLTAALQAYKGVQRASAEARNVSLTAAIAHSR